MATLAISGACRTTILDRAGAYGDAVSRLGSWASTAAIAVIFLWFGCMKFIPFEAESLQPIIANNPLMSWLYTLFGVIGPRLSALGGAMGVWSFLLTVSCLFTTPGVIQPNSIIGLGPVGSFLIKDIVLLSVCAWIVGASLTEVQARARP